MRRLALSLAALLLALPLAACGGGKGKSSTKTLTVVVNAPFSQTPYVGDSIAHGVELAVADANGRGGVTLNGVTYRLRVEKLDNRLSPAQAVRNVRRAVREHAVSIVDEGTGVDASWRIARAAGIPLCIVYQGGVGLVDPVGRPNVFRIAPTDHGIAFRFAEYLIPKGLKIALLHDDSGYGIEGAKALDDAFSYNPRSVAKRLTLPSSASDLAPQIVQARRAEATALLVWASAPTLAKTIIAARSSGWRVPIYAAPSAEDPLVRQELSDNPDWLNGLTFGSGRMTAEAGPGPFLNFVQRYENEFGPDLVGVKDPRGRPIAQPPDYAMYPFDYMNLLVQALYAPSSGKQLNLVAGLDQVTVHGVNGDERGFNEKNHEGVVDDDVYFASFHGMTFAPVKDDPLSATLPVIEQRR